MLHYACLFKKNSCKLYTYSGKFPSLKRLCSGYGGKFLHQKLDKCLCKFSMLDQEVGYIKQSPTPAGIGWYPPWFERGDHEF
jgi:hypothetical protein